MKPSTSANCKTSHDVGKSLSVCEINFVKVMKFTGHYYVKTFDIDCRTTIFSLTLNLKAT